MMRKALLVVALLSVVATACRAEVKLGVDVLDDGSGTVVVEFGLDDELLELIESFGGSTDDIITLIPEGEDIEVRTEGDMTIYSASQDFSDDADLERLIEEFSTENDLDFVDFQLDVADGGAVLRASVVAPDITEESLAGIGDFGDLGEDVLTASLDVRLPGTVVESNADQVLPDGSLRWALPVFGGEVDVMAVSEAGGGSFPIGVAVGVAVVLALGAGLFLWMRRRGDLGASAIEATPAPEAPAAVFDETRPAPPADHEQPPSSGEPSSPI